MVAIRERGTVTVTYLKGKHLPRVSALVVWVMVT